MGLFLKKTLFILLLFVLLEIILLLVIPKDKNSSLCEYNHKISLLKTTKAPRIIIIGGSNVAFGIDSKMLIDSIQMNVVNFGLHAGIGIRYVMNDYLKYIKKGDVVVMQVEYSNFFTGGNGNDRTLTQLMAATDFRNIEFLNFKQYVNIVEGIPTVVIGNLNRLIKYPLRKCWDSPSKKGVIGMNSLGYNAFGDRVEHWDKKSSGIKPRNQIESRKLDNDFLIWFVGMLNQYEKKGVKVIMVPPVSVTTHFKETYSKSIGDALKSFHRPYMVDEDYMVLDDSCSYNGGYHVNRNGVIQNTNHLIEILRKEI